MSATTTTRIQLDLATRDRVQRLADIRQSSAEDVMREAIEQYVERTERQAELREELKERWSEYEESGLHVTAEEADEWLRRLARGERPALPEPHR